MIARPSPPRRLGGTGSGPATAPVTRGDLACRCHELVENGRDLGVARARTDVVHLAGFASLGEQAIGADHVTNVSEIPRRIEVADTDLRVAEESHASTTRRASAETTNAVRLARTRIWLKGRTRTTSRPNVPRNSCKPMNSAATLLVAYGDTGRSGELSTSG